MRPAWRSSIRERFEKEENAMTTITLTPEQKQKKGWLSC